MKMEKPEFPSQEEGTGYPATKGGGRGKLYGGRRPALFSRPSAVKTLFSLSSREKGGGGGGGGGWGVGLKPIPSSWW